ncbi:MAG TPA: glycosyltransferase family 4 protein [Chitinophagaceae bacterium]|nr:glycosyltransferase family 4 protein [Chitinophagaceae bacterium]
MEGIPHFIYTDHTTQTNLLYPNINPKQYICSKRFIEKCEFKIYQDATMIFTFGSLPYYSLINQYKIPAEKVMTVFLGCNVSNDYFENPKKYTSRNILFVGAAWERKGGPMLIEVFKNVLNRYPDSTLTIVGCKPGNITVPNCNILGKIPLKSLSEHYNSANVFCLPTLKEPFGAVFIEAMNYRLPVIANNIGCLSDLVTNDFNGYLINNNVNDYTKAICSLFENPEKCKIMGENGYQYARSKFTWQQVGKKIRTSIDKYL